jgi:type III pantothenate kinase
MLLVIDIGNTNIVIARYKGDKQEGVWRITTDPKRTSDEYLLLLKNLGEAGNHPLKDSPKHAIIGSVVPQCNHSISKCLETSGIRTKIMGEDKLEYGIDIQIDNPKEVGADRVLNTIAARKIYGTPAIIVDFGTATTFDLLTEEGTYGGGVISPGLNLSAEALHSAAAMLPRIALSRPKKTIGKNTKDAMLSGLYLGYVSLIEGVTKRMADEIGLKDIKIIATGGLARLFGQESGLFHHIDTDLTLTGLRMLYETNKELY